MKPKNILFEVQEQIADLIRADSCLSSITWLEENRRDIEFEIKNALGKQGLVGIVMTPNAEYIGDYSNKTLVWEINPLEIDIVENVPVARGMNSALSVTGQDASMRLFDVLCPQRNNQREGAICPVSYEQGEDNSLLVNKCTFKCYVTDYDTADNEDTVVTYLNGTVKSLPIVGEISSTSIADKANVKSIRVGKTVNSIGIEAFMNCTAMETITIPDTVLSVKQRAFRRCTSLSSLTIPESVGDIRQSAFETCSELTSIQLPSELSAFGTQVFMNCSKLQEATVPGGITTLPNGTFNNCTALSSVVLPSGIQTIDDYAFHSSGLQELSVPNTVRTINRYGFNNSNITSLTMEDKSTLEVQRMIFYPWGLRTGCIIHCINGNLVV